MAKPGRLEVVASDVLVAVQWRTSPVASEVAFYSHPLWEDELQKLRDGFITGH